jgi:hypothetical protein
MTSYHSKSVKNVVLEQVLTFSSEAATKLDNQNKPENFATRFDPVITLPNNLSYKVGLVKMNATYSWHNIEATANNNTVRYSPDAGLTFKTITFPDGVYSYTDIDSFIKNAMKENGDYTVVDGVDTFDFGLQFSSSTFLVTINLQNNMFFDLYTQAFSDLIGFDVQVLTVTSQGVRLPNINRSLDNIYVHSTLVNGSIVDGKATDIIFSFSTDRLSRGFPFSFEPSNIMFSPMSGSSLSNIRFYLTRFDGSIIDLNNIPTSYTVIIRGENIM